MMEMDRIEFIKFMSMKKDFTDTEREACTNKLEKLILLSQRNNLFKGDADYVDKKKLYFSSFDYGNQAGRGLYSDGAVVCGDVV